MPFQRITQAQRQANSNGTLSAGVRPHAPTLSLGDDGCFQPNPRLLEVGDHVFWLCFLITKLRT